MLSSSGLRLIALCGLCAPWCAAAPAEERVAPPAGFVVSDFQRFEPGLFVGGVAYSPDGFPIVAAGSEVRLYGPGSPRILAAFDPPLAGSFLVPDPAADAVLFGESIEWKVYSVPLSGAGAMVADDIPFAFDLAFDARGRGLVSAATGGAQQILLFDRDPSSPNPPVVINIPGFSGPIAFDPDGHLYYGTADFSGDPDRQSLHRFRREQLDLALEKGPLDFADGEVLLTAIDGFFSLRWHEGKLYSSELGFASGTGTLRVSDPAAGFDTEVFALFPAKQGIVSPSYFAFRPGARPFAPGSGAKGGSLLVAFSDFSTVNDIAEITPELHFVRGRVNRDDVVDLSDAVALLNFLFRDGAPPEPLEAADINGDGERDISDAIYLLNHLFLGGPAPPAPYPEPGPAPRS
jgi:hypothetical protein